MESEKVCVMGLGYIGLPMAALLATKGFQVHGVDIKQEVVDIINQGKIHIVEPELDAFVKSAVNSGNLKASTKPEKSNVFIIAVPTPITEDKQPDIRFVEEASVAIAPYLNEGNLMIIESTSPVGTTELIVDKLEKEGVPVDKMYFAYSPERVLPGQTMRELVGNDRIVGGINKESAIQGMLFYESFIQGEVLITDARTAEMAKLTENANRDVNIAFANELSVLCDKFNIDVWELINLANRHPRINILKPGSGVGGHCIAVDPWFIVANAKEEARIIKDAREINDGKPVWVVNKIKELIDRYKNKKNRQPKVACLGIAFKPDIDDLRESPSLRIVNDLLNEGLEIMICEPNIKTHSTFNLIDYSEAIQEADIIVLLVAHKEFKKLIIDDSKTVLDVCGVLSPHNK